MNKKFFYGISIMTMMFTATSCGGGEEETTEESTEVTEEVVEEVVEPVVYSVDTESSIVNWNNFEGGEKDHSGTVKMLEGSYTLEGDVITAASLTMDMNTLTCDSEKLLGHISNEDFFDVNNYTSASFTLDRHENGLVYGTLNAVGIDFAVEAPVTLGEGSVEISDFKIDMGQLPYFVAERAENPEEEWHDINIGFSASITGTTAAE